MKEIISLENLKKYYHNVKVVDIKQLSVKKGEVYGFLGLNGAGKSTTMKMILSLVVPDDGHIFIDTKDITEDTHYLDQIGSMIEEPSYYPNLTAYENLLVFQKMIGFELSYIEKTLRMVGLDDENNQKKLVKNYSLGMKQRLALAFALVKQPRILLLDEPTNGLDPSGIHDIRELISHLAKEEGLTILISSHILSEIEQVADRVGILNHGQLVYEGRIEDIKANQWIDIRGDFSDMDKLHVILAKHPEVIVRSIAEGGHQLILDNLKDNRISDLVFDLVASGHEIHHVSRERENLEDIFLALTAE